MVKIKPLRYEMEFMTKREAMFSSLGCFVLGLIGGGVLVWICGG